MVSNSFVQHVAWEMFSPSRFESFISILSHAKCVNNQGTKLNGINLPKYGSMVTKYFSTIAKMKDKAYAPKVYHYLLMTSLACDQLWAHFLCHNYVSVFYHKSRLYSWQIQHFSKSGGWLTRLRQHKTSLFSSLCQWLETQLQLGCLSSEDTPCCPWLPILLIHIWSQVKTKQSQSYKFKEFAKSSIFSLKNKCYMRHTCWSRLIRCVNMKWIRWVLLKIQVDNVKPVYLTQLCCSRVCVILQYSNCFAIIVSPCTNDKEWCPFFDKYVSHGPQTGVLKLTPLDSPEDIAI